VLVHHNKLATARTQKQPGDTVLLSTRQYCWPTSHRADSHSNVLYRRTVPRFPWHVAAPVSVHRVGQVTKHTHLSTRACRCWRCRARSTRCSPGSGWFDAVGMGATRSEFRTPCAAMFSRQLRPRPARGRGHPPHVRLQDASAHGAACVGLVGALLGSQLARGLESRVVDRLEDVPVQLLGLARADDGKKERDRNDTVLLSVR